MCTYAGNLILMDTKSLVIVESVRLHVALNFSTLCPQLLHPVLENGPLYIVLICLILFICEILHVDGVIHVQRY